MPYELTIELFEDYIRAEVAGDRRPGHEVNDAMSTGRQLLAACRSHSVSKVLIIFKMTGRLPPTEAYEIYSDPQEFDWNRDVKIAVVDINQESKEDTFFCETVAVNRAYDTQVFDEEHEALKWLMET